MAEFLIYLVFAAVGFAIGWVSRSIGCEKFDPDEDPCH